MKTHPLFRAIVAGAALLAPLAASLPDTHAACCYFSAKSMDVDQPSQKAFITWDPETKTETFTVQPKFTGNATDFGMVIPTPAQPKLDEMPRDFFTALATFTIWKPDPRRAISMTGAKSPIVMSPPPSPASTVTVLEAGVVGTLDYKIVAATAAADLYQWLQDNGYHYGGDEATLEHYINKGWFFTVMKIDPQQMVKQKPRGLAILKRPQFSGEITPTRFSFTTESPVYPLRITAISVAESTEALLYIQAPFKADLSGSATYLANWVPSFVRYVSNIDAKQRTVGEVRSLAHLEPVLTEYEKMLELASSGDNRPAILEWAHRLQKEDMALLSGEKEFYVDLDEEAQGQLRLLQGHLKPGHFLVKVRKTFTPGEMSADLDILQALVAGKADMSECMYHIR